MNQNLEKEPFPGLKSRSLKTRGPEPELANPKLSFKQLLLIVGMALGAVLGILIMIALLVVIVFLVISGLKTLISVLQS